MCTKIAAQPANFVLQLGRGGGAFLRMAAEDVEIGGVKIAKGDWLMINYVAANHDPAVFENPRKFDAARENNRHAAFGAGAHQCLGLHLARLEMRILFEALGGVGKVVPNNTHFDTTRANIEATGAEAIDLVIAWRIHHVA